MHEFNLIKTYFAPLSASEEGAMMLTDDAAVVEPKPNNNLVYTKDIMIAGTHFFPDDKPVELAQKLLAVNVSDLAAMGALPRGYLLGLALPSNLKEAWITDFASGFKLGMERFGGALFGGDTTSHRAEAPLVLSLTAIGEIPKDKALKRSRAQIGDDIYVTGTIGDAAAGLMLLQTAVADYSLLKEEADYLRSRYHLPSPRQDWGGHLRGLANSCADISDGLVADAGHIASASSVAIHLEAEKVPLSSAVIKLLDAKAINLETVLAGGDDYELCFSAPASKRKDIDALSDKLNVTATRIGRVVVGNGVKVTLNQQLLMLSRRGYQHFN